MCRAFEAGKSTGTVTSMISEGVRNVPRKIYRTMTTNRKIHQAGAIRLMNAAKNALDR